MFWLMDTPKHIKRKRPAEISLRFVARLKQLRQEKGWSQMDLAQRLGLQKTSVANYEQGMSFPPLPTLEKMARLFGVSLDGLVWGNQPPEQVIKDRELLDLFRRIDCLSSRIRAAVIEVLAGIAFKAEHEVHQRAVTDENCPAPPPALDLACPK